MGKELLGEKFSRKLFVKRGIAFVVGLSTAPAWGGTRGQPTLPEVLAPRVPWVPPVRVGGTSFLRCNFVSHHRDEIGTSGKSDRSEAASFKGAVLNEDRAHHIGSLKRDLPQHGVRGACDASLDEVALAGVDDGWASYLAIDEDEAADNRFVSCEFGEANDPALVRLVGGHRSLLRWMEGSL